MNRNIAFGANLNKSFFHSVYELLFALHRNQKHQKIPYYYHNRRANAAEGIKSIIDFGFPVANAEPFAIAPPIEWGAELPNNREWQVIRNAFFSVDYLLQAYLDKGDLIYFDLAADTAADWVTYNLVEERYNKIKWSDICCGLRAFYFAFIINNDSRLLDNLERGALLVEGAFAHANQLLNPKNIAKSNHAIFQALGLATLAELFNFLPQSVEWERVAVEILNSVIVAQYGNEGVHLEHSPYYHGWVLERIKQVSTMPWFSSVEKIASAINLSERNFVHFFHPDLSLAEIGESSPEKVNWVRDLHDFTKWAVSKGKEGSRPQCGDILFKEAGYAIVRDTFDNGLGSSYLILTAGHHSPSHKQNDCLSFEWSDFGQKIMVDAGKYAYDFDEKRDYVMSRRAHNVVEIEGEIFDPKMPYGAGKLQLSIGEDGEKRISASIPGKSNNVQVYRELVIKHGEYLVCIDFICVDDGNRYVCNQWFHFHPSLQLLGVKEDSYSFKLPNNGVLTASALNKTYSHKFYLGDESPNLQGWISPSYGVLSPAPCIGFNQTINKNFCFVSLFRLSESPLIIEDQFVRFSDTGVIQLGWRDLMRFSIEVKVPFGETLD